MKRGEIWSVDFDPTQGDEIQKLRPAVIVSIAGLFRQRLHIVVPITSWQPRFQHDFWMIHLPADATTALKNESAANTSQVKSVSDTRLKNSLGRCQPFSLSRLLRLSRSASALHHKNKPTCRAVMAIN